MLLLVPFISTVWATKNSCPNYLCSLAPNTESTCIKSITQNNTLSITPCISGLECIYSSPQFYTCNHPQKSLPGDQCNLNNQCLSNLCFSNKCQGRPLGSSCTTSADCNIFLYCNEYTFTCVNQIAFDHQCNNTYECSSNLACDGKKCVYYFSIPIGSSVYNVPNYGLSYACTSGFAYNNTCSQAPISNSTNPISCNNGDFCISNDGKYSKPCICGYDGNSYCPLFEGDFALQNSIRNFSAISQQMRSCHTMLRFSYSCYYAYSALKAFLPWKATADLYFNDDWVKKINNSACVNETLTANYWNTASPRPYYPMLCSSHVCVNNTQDWANNQCINFESLIVYSSIENTNFISQCSSGFICNSYVNSDVNATCIPNITLSNPGEFCINNSQCTTLNCNDNICIGLSVNEFCSSYFSCNPGLYCDRGRSNKCLKSKEIGESCSYNGPKCALGLQCSKYNICILSFSQSSGQAGTGRDINGIDYSCISGFSNFDNPSKISFCADAPVTGFNTYCTAIYVCYDSTGNYNRPCECPFNGYAECPQFQGDYSLTTAIKAFNNTYYDWEQCNTGGLTYRCFLGNLTQLYNYAIYLTNITVYLNSPKLNNCTKDCVSETYFPEFWFLMDIINSYNPNPNPLILPAPGYNCPGYAEYSRYPEYPQYPWNKNEYPEYPQYLEYPKYPLYGQDCNNTVMPAYPMYPAYPAYPEYPND
ncbi:hypothetical protein SteCoe_37278 [Stentor coeruleus]|uniref:Uncharacterized protein n=1 Tax=Stentor coeruleus TaxID=5963 RepID=A0A1R2ANK8_9CILI|nr:hypothetical protein SteCoe_37278 [Stentor coeruleus]